ncbi:quinoprotein dehydrogenase-associated SoxYZ-like carrier [uncultured Sphingomonas sp.]|uniref:quinoprotein dehydrogenase-associated SoxYZ-like carrier n=1 Tax=uncultured Sphingomonas sp. TaxID=158754 RepID=UPI0025DC39F2|nr:quinoprotein dehydrogenase-associated SoxYZ-like carrier [uncultured Sphingomonas sp.]
MRIASGSLVAALLAAVSAPASATLPADPLASPMWDFVADQAFGAGARVAFDPRVKVRFPDIAENQRVFPVEIDARGIADVKRIVILVDLNPIQLPIDYRLDDAEPFIATRIKLDQRTPVRGAVQLADGSWLVSGGWIDAAGGGCSAPPASRVSGDWAQHLGEVRGGLWRTATGPRAQIAFRHPMDTGFVANIASYYIDQLTLTGADGRSLGMVAMQAAVAEDPVLTLLPHARTGEMVRFHARDTNGIDYRGTLADRGGPAA